MLDIVFWGATGQAKVLDEALQASPVRLVALIDNRSVASPFPAVPLFVGESQLDLLLERYGPPERLHFAVAVGGARGIDRLKIFRLLIERGLHPYTIIHRTAFVAADAHVGPGCQVLAMAAVCCDATLEAAVIVNTGASVDHDCIVRAGSHIGPGARLAGEIDVGERVFIGTGAVVLPRVRIGNDAIVGAGAVVVQDVPPGQTVVGNPARPLEARLRSSTSSSY